MFVTKRALSRRTVLRGMGTAVALPFLESMVPAFQALAQSPARPPMRFGAVYFPNGAPMSGANNFWMPAAQGELQITPILKPLEAFKDQMTVVGNLSRAGGKSVTDHAVSSAGWLSGAVAKQTEAEDIHVGVTIDQVLARQIGQDTPFPSLELATEDFSGYVGGCVPGYSCAYMNTLSWAGPTSPLPMEINPRVAFERMFGRAADGNQRLERMRENRSILDSVAGEAQQLQRRLGSQDRARLDEYLGTVREIERRIERTEARNAASVTAVVAPAGVPETFEEHAAVMFDLLAVAYQADLTRVFTFMMAREASQRTYPALNIPETHHDVSLFGAFVEKLRTSPEADGSVLDHSLIVFGGGMSDGQAHSAYPLPLAALGGASGKMKGNRFMLAGEWTPVANLWLSVAGMFGSPIEQFGESNGRVSL
jgi:hypothetical protein